jgi:hypothetical protein
MSLFDQLSSALSGEHAGLLGNVLDTPATSKGEGCPVSSRPSTRTA